MSKGAFGALLVLIVLVAGGGLLYSCHKAPPSVVAGEGDSPIWPSREGHETAIIFVHGIIGDLRSTFTAPNALFGLTCSNQTRCSKTSIFTPTDIARSCFLEVSQSRSLRMRCTSPLLKRRLSQSINA